MDGSGFKALTRLFGERGIRRRALLGGALLSAFALPRPGAAKTQAGKRTKRKSASAPKLLWAVVDPDGRLAFGNGATAAAKHQSEGAYEVSFDRDVSACGHVAHVPLFYAPGEAFVTPGAASVTVFTYDTGQGRVAANKAFHLMVMC
ncbi:MAG TPA: hypothetical protein VFU81_03410 [Thermomicrobiales bacterium]|nr:hypothetical protein [Thermomicrobiales bacterium]